MKISKIKSFKLATFLMALFCFSEANSQEVVSQKIFNQLQHLQLMTIALNGLRDNIESIDLQKGDSVALHKSIKLAELIERHLYSESRTDPGSEAYVRLMDDFGKKYTAILYGGASPPMPPTGTSVR